MTLSQKQLSRLTQFSTLETDMPPYDEMRAIHIYVSSPPSITLVPITTNENHIADSPGIAEVKELLSDKDISCIQSWTYLCIVPIEENGRKLAAKGPRPASRGRKESELWRTKTARLENSWRLA